MPLFVVNDGRPTGLLTEGETMHLKPLTGRDADPIFHDDAFAVYTELKEDLEGQIRRCRSWQWAKAMRLTRLKLYLEHRFAREYDTDGCCSI